MKKGLLIIYSGPSGVGKSTILAELLKDSELNLDFSISMTTRNPRGQEKDKVDYYFVDKDTFEKAIKNDEFLEYARYVDNYYGTPRKHVEEKRNEGKNVVLEIDIQGGKQVIEKCPDAISIFILPPSLEELRKRLVSRDTDNKDVIEKRLAQAQSEIDQSVVYKYRITNNDIEESVNSIKQLIKDNMNK